MSNVKINDLTFNHALDQDAIAAVSGGWGLVGKIGGWIAKRSKRVYKRLRRGQYYAAYRTLLAPLGGRSRSRDRRR